MSMVASSRGSLAVIAAFAATLAPVCSLHAAPSTVDDRIALGLQGESLTNTNGGGGAAISWLHNFNADVLAGVGVEHQALANAHWTFGSLNGSYSIGQGDERYSFYGEAHEGGGNSGNKSLSYHIEALGVAGTYFHKLSILFEDRQFYVDTVSGNLPKLGVSYLWNPHVQTSVSYSYSIGSNLGTRLLGGKIDLYEPGLNWLAGFSVGQATAAVLTGSSLVTGEDTFAPGLRVKEGYVGATLPLPRLRSELTLIFDYQHLSSSVVSSDRYQGNLNYIFHLGHHGT
ncbi:MAG: hypothetical protein QOI59_850 [Gammaproteobacteria bacterium]|nr:hypothetical protein [Gammaproteobacteria bacterium]